MPNVCNEEFPMILGKSLADWRAQYPLLDELIALRETSWFNPAVAP